MSRIDEPGIPELIPGARPVPHAKANRDDSVEVVRMDQPAPAVVATTHDPNVKKNPDDVLRQIFPDPSRYEGIYARINDSDGKIAVIQASSFRTGVHIQWVPPALARKRFAGGYREVEDRISE